MNKCYDDFTECGKHLFAVGLLQTLHESIEHCNLLVVDGTVQGGNIRHEQRAEVLGHHQELDELSLEKSRVSGVYFLLECFPSDGFAAHVFANEGLRTHVLGLEGAGYLEAAGEVEWWSVWVKLAYQGCCDRVPGNKVGGCSRL